MRVYILFSPSLSRHYTGFSVDIARRHAEHKRGSTQSTCRADDWVCVWSVSVASRMEARALEKRIKAQGAKRYLERLANVTQGDSL